MPFDGFFTRAMVNELKSELMGGRISKIHQPYKNELVMAVRAGRQNHKLLISSHPSYARVQITGDTFDNPTEPPMFCMILRKHLEGAIIQDIKQVNMDRIIIFEIRGRDELGDESYKQLIVEIMGRHSNIILVDKEKEKIIDSIKHIPTALNSYRTILPGSSYIYPPEQDKVNPLSATEEDVLKKIDFNSGKLDKQIVEKFSGFSPILAKELIFKAALANRVTVPKSFVLLMEQLKNHQYEPSITVEDEKEHFYLFPLTHIKGEIKKFSSLSEMLDRFYFGKADRDRVKQQAFDLERLMKNEKTKNETKVKKLKATLEAAEKADEYQLLGELLTANMHLVKRGMKDITVINYYDENGGQMTIVLDPRKSPSENAQSYYTKYQKAKNSVQVVKEQIEKAKDEINYFDGLLQQLTSARARDIEEIREELAEQGYLRLRNKKGQRKNPNAKPVIDRYESADGTEILVGKNNKQNDYLTNKLAGRDEIWLHTKDIPGSHVVIRSKDPSVETINEAAILAAYFSKAKNSASVPVDFTKIRHVKKPNGSKPGFVIYDNQQTVYVTPDEDSVKEMQRS
ncbi:NFACT family protein [Lederbergia wuyishanensis]|uniref:Rqc2 homolog RqcH n=1 Tax=Lederbergia wuyishanensis TaxID=1347903 RepID=A0ABU0CZK1_9BACI|nr:NFACT RNA binding domain-containing protein [Lederbergia wuyishanensis]MCJ8006208.1 NFACT family protein [Lederbergia wuyishanensis]MDQ0341578.1 putative ribosome quality control (RQC) complex YloA/Tae2 family protein [Lederbergia wuyishanensis]